MTNSTFSADFKDKLVLNVDDSEMNQLVIAKILEKLGLKMVTALNGSEAVKLLSGGLKPDLILMDLQMPEMNGIETTEYIRKKLYIEIPIIINSGSIEDYERWRLNRLGVSDFLEKPYSINDISSKMAKNFLNAVV